MTQPFESKEFLDKLKWQTDTHNRKLESIECIAIWTDICGFGNLLQNNEWDLLKLQNAGLVELLNEVYSIAGRVMLPFASPMPSDRILVLNDGIAKTLDLNFKNYLDGHTFLFFLRDSIFNHYFLLKTTENYGVGIRTVFAGGARIQYSPEKITGHSVLYYDNNNISDFGKKILETQFLYNPSEFQMNTAFAKAFTIDSLGTKEGINVNGLYIESSFIDLIEDIPNLKVQIEDNKIDISYKDTLMFKIYTSKTIIKKIKGLEVKIYHIKKFKIYKEFDGDDLEFIVYKKHKRTVDNKK